LNHVNAKQTNGQLTPQQAADLSQQAKAIQQAIGCSNSLLDFENAILDLFEKNRIQDAKTVLWTLLTAIYEDELVEEAERREIIISNIERQKELLLINILGQR
jgi:hypothetical protein